MLRGVFLEIKGSAGGEEALLPSIGGMRRDGEGVASVDLLSAVESAETPMLKVGCTLHGVETTATVKEGETLELKGE